MLAASPRADVARDFLTSLGEMPSDGDGQEYRPLRPAQRPCRDFVVAEEIPGNGDGQKVLAASSRKEVARDFLSSPGEMPSNSDDRVLAGTQIWRGFRTPVEMEEWGIPLSPRC